MFSSKAMLPTAFCVFVYFFLCFCIYFYCVVIVVVCVVVFVIFVCYIFVMILLLLSRNAMSKWLKALRDQGVVDHMSEILGVDGLDGYKLHTST